MTGRRGAGPRRIAALGLCLTASVGACAVAAPVDKQGAPATAATELVLGTPDPVDPRLPSFVEAVDRLSEHRLRIRVENTTWNTETPGGEARLTGDVRAGAVPLGYIPSRDLATDGAPAFQALHAPLLVGTTSDTVALATGPLARDVLASLDDRGLHGLALVPLEVRRLLSKRPVLALDDLAGARIRINDSAQTARLVTAWSAIPVQGYLAATTHAELAKDRLDAVESSPLYITANAYFATAPYLTSFGLFPKFDVLVANPQAWQRFSDADRATLTAAAAETLTRAVTATPELEAAGLDKLCARGVVVVRPSDQALGELKAAAARAQPDDARVTAWVGRVRESLAAVGISGTSPPPGTSGARTTSATPPGCPVATSADEALRLHDAATSPSGAPNPTAGGQDAAVRFPTGTYRTFVTREMWKAQDVTSSLATADITFTTTFGADGTLTQSQQPDFPDQGTFVGTYAVTGDLLTITYHSVLDPTTVNVESVRWSYLRGELHFVVVDVLDSGSRVIYGQPWRKVA